jgi:hypothetical protein
MSEQDFETTSLKTNQELVTWLDSKPKRLFYIIKNKDSSEHLEQVDFYQLKKKDRFIAFDGVEPVEGELGAKEFIATSDPYYDELVIPCIEVLQC